VKKRNARLGASLIDYLLTNGEDYIYLEVKSAALKSGSYAMYPDCPSLRGRRHIHDLMEYYNRGGRAVILFIAAVPDVIGFMPNREGDKTIFELLLDAYKSGMEIRAINIYYDPSDSYIYLKDPDLGVVMSGDALEDE
jgi:sugar fermentation stimulation protein A